MEFHHSLSLRLPRSSVAKTQTSAVHPSDPPCKWEGAVLQWLHLITLQQLQTCRATAKGPKPHSQARGQALQCAEATGRLAVLRATHRSLLCHKATPCNPVLLLPHQVLQKKLQGGEGIKSVNTTALTTKCHGPCVQLAGTLGREVCLFRSMHTVTAAVLSGPRQEDGWKM